MKSPNGLPRSLIAAVLLMTLVVLALGGAVLAVKLRPPERPRGVAEDSIAAWEKAVASNPKDDWSRVGLGLALREAGRDSEALEAFEKALDLNEKNWAALYQTALVVKDSDLDRALRLLDQAVKYAPKTSKAGPLVAAGDLMLASEDAEGARDAYRKAIADVPFLFDAHFGLGNALEALGDEKGALEQYREAGRYVLRNAELEEAIARVHGKNS